MKTFLLSLLTLAISQSASAAITQQSSWKEIFAAKGPYVIHSPAIYMGRAIDYTFVCRDGDTLRTQAPVDNVYALQDGTGRTVFQKVGSEVLSTPIHYTQTEDFCDSSGSKTICKPLTYTGVYPMTVDIKVGHQLKDGFEAYLFTKSYTIPNCDSVTVE